MRHVLVIQGLDIPSLNSWLGKHWSKRSGDKGGIEWAVRGAVLEAPDLPRPFDRAVDIWVTAHAQTHVNDSDNLAGGVKAIVDGLRYAEVLREDNTSCVRWVGQLLVVDSGEPWVEVVFEEVER